jgi:hypothetical protein
MTEVDPEICVDRLVSITPFLVQWNLDAVKLWHKEHPSESRIKLSSLTRHDYLYDMFIGYAEVAVTPVPVKVCGYARMRWLLVVGDDFDIAIWPKNIDYKTLLTSNYPTNATRQRQRDGEIPSDWMSSKIERPTILFVCGRTIFEDLAGDECWIQNIWLTREGVDAENNRLVTFKRVIYTNNSGSIPLAHDEQQRMFPTPAALVQPKAKVVVRKNLPHVAKDGDAPKVGTQTNAQSRKASRKAGRAADGSKGA